LEIFKKSRILFQELLEDAKSYLSFKFSQADELFSPASPFGQLLSVIINLGKLILYYIEDSITELNIYTASRNSSIKTLSIISGHNPSRAISSQGLISLKWKEKDIDINGNTILIPNYTKIINQSNSLTYTIYLESDFISVPLLKNSLTKVKIYQGEIETQQVTGTGEQLQSYNIRTKRGAQIENNLVKVFVNNEEWKPYCSLYDIPYDAPGYVIRTGLYNGIDIFFGNGYNGKIPPLGETIRIEYIVTDGALGNVFKKDEAQFVFDDFGIDLQGNEIDLNEVFDIRLETPLLFGSNEEPIELTRLLTANVSRSFVLANEKNYLYFLQKFNQFSTIEVFNNYDDNDPSNDNIIYLFLIPDITKRVQSNTNYFEVSKDRFLLTEDEKNRILELIKESGQQILTSEIIIINPILKEYVMNVNIRAYQGYSKDNIRKEVIDKISNYLLHNKRRDKIPKSDIISLLENIKGIDSVNVWFISKENEIARLNGYIGEDIGLDEFGDISINKNEYPIIRGGWYDRNNIEYIDGISSEKLSSLNIFFSKKDSIETTMNELNQNIKTKIKNA